jgi:aspartyl-tRNA(Asn)/glutamyl-tRNA(Gln) amidotransferase subunit B
VKRQIDLIEAGGKVEQQTLNFDPATGVTSPLREKEDAHDYRYFPEPDLPPVVLSPEYLEEVRQELPPLPWEVYAHFTAENGLSDYDASILFEERETVLLFEAVSRFCSSKKGIANLLINRLIPYCQEQKIRLGQFPVPPEHLGAFILLIDSGKVSNSTAYQRLFPAMIESPGSSPEALATSLNLLQQADDGFLADLIRQVLEANPDKVKEYQKGKKGLMGFFMGELMKRSKGKADPAKATQMLSEALKS